MQVFGVCEPLNTTFAQAQPQNNNYNPNRTLKKVLCWNLTWTPQLQIKRNLNIALTNRTKLEPTLKFEVLIEIIKLILSQSNIKQVHQTIKKQQNRDQIYDS